MTAPPMTPDSIARELSPAQREVAGLPRISDAEAVEIWRIIEVLTDEEGDTVNVLCPNPDFNGQPGYAIECNGSWTNWEDRRFADDNQVECFRIALAAYRLAVREALKGME